MFLLMNGEATACDLDNCICHPSGVQVLDNLNFPARPSCPGLLSLASEGGGEIVKMDPTPDHFREALGIQGKGSYT